MCRHANCYRRRASVVPRKPKEPRVPYSKTETIKISRDAEGQWSAEPVESQPITIEMMWERLISGFKMLREYEGAENVARMERLMAVLRQEADDTFLDSGYRERGEQLERPALRERFNAAGLTGDPVAEQDYAWIAAIAAECDLPTPPGLRNYARGVWVILSMHEMLMPIARKQLKGPTGRPRSIAMETMLDYADRMNAGDAAVARRLAAEGLLPEGSGSLDSPVEQWKAVIRSARQRRRQR